MDYIVWMDGEKVRCFTNKSLDYVKKWVKLYCRGGNIRVTTPRKDCGLPKASSRKIKPNLDMPDLVYKPFVSLS